MTKYIQGSDGKFAGSIGDGKTNVPTAGASAPVAPVTSAPARTLEQVKLELEDAYAALRASKQTRYELSKEALTLVAKDAHPDAAYALIRIRPVDDEDGGTYTEIAGLEDADGTLIYDAESENETGVADELRPELNNHVWEMEDVMWFEDSDQSTISYEQYGHHDRVYRIAL